MVQSDELELPDETRLFLAVVAWGRAMHEAESPGSGARETARESAASLYSRKVAALDTACALGALGEAERDAAMGTLKQKHDSIGADTDTRRSLAAVVAAPLRHVFE